MYFSTTQLWMLKVLIKPMNDYRLTRTTVIHSPNRFPKEIRKSHKNQFIWIVDPENQTDSGFNFEGLRIIDRLLLC